jgi:hypothetical protein
VRKQTFKAWALMDGDVLHRNFYEKASLFLTQQMASLEAHYYGFLNVKSVKVTIEPIKKPKRARGKK